MASPALAVLTIAGQLQQKPLGKVEEQGLLLTGPVGTCLPASTQPNWGWKEDECVGLEPCLHEGMRVECLGFHGLTLLKRFLFIFKWKIRALQ